MNLIQRTAPLVREWLFPAGCVLCGTYLSEYRDALCGVCRFCRNTLEINRDQRCVSCGRPLISEKSRCLSCRRGEEFSFDKAVSVFPYEGNYRKIMSGYKYGKNRALGFYLAESFFRALELFGPDGVPETWVPVPPRPGKIKSAGWDQIACLARCLRILSRSRSIQGEYTVPEFSLRSCLKRLPSKSQKELSKEDRKTNLLGKIVCAAKPASRILLFDDVITTGATLDVCSRVLKDAGAETVYAVSLFYD
ncbi:ComF family protein [Breznakiella homolactica]|uniref:ComF family protein n=1 Tax=Breznakiella homolactica TaxID=2798577 RepID=A0A7T7XKR8_9SPIR|nr:double zinc ribbon domain-containing protein [Breznakiella homolactica]QQO08199.1 double zinc ribbon domain-containing protein [Breznakiella homolactica]